MLIMNRRRGILLFPAQAGVILRRKSFDSDDMSVPRASGGDRLFFIIYIIRKVCSPRKRG